MARASACTNVTSLGTIVEEDFSQEAAREEQAGYYNALIDAATNAVRQADAALRHSRAALVSSDHAPHAMRAVQMNKEQLYQAHANLSAVLSQCLGELYYQGQKQQQKTLQEETCQHEIPNWTKSLVAAFVYR
jgi:hypothetical protein